jgi:hypothetical protein
LASLNSVLSVQKVGRRVRDDDVAMLLRIENPEIRAGIVEDILSLHRPVLNDLLRSQHGGLRG